jgi:hypothetical protein
VKLGNNIHAHCTELRERSAKLRVKATALRNKHRDSTRATEPASGGAVYEVPPPPPNPHDVAMEALRLIRSIIDPFPIEWQVAIVKASTARTILLTHERIRPALPTLSA